MPRQQAEALADAGVYRAVYGLLSPKSEGLLSPQILDLLTLSSEPAALRRRIEHDLRSELGETFFPEAADPFVDGWRTDGTVYVWPFGDGQVWVSIQDEDGKIDLNTARDELLRGLFVSVGLDQDDTAALVDAIVDFRDEDNLHRLQGAEDVEADPVTRNAVSGRRTTSWHGPRDRHENRESFGCLLSRRFRPLHPQLRTYTSGVRNSRLCRVARGNLTPRRS